MDMNLHTSDTHSTLLVKNTWKDWMAPFDLGEETGQLCSWIDMFGGRGLEGIYYSNKWSEVIAADVFESFIENGAHQNDEVLSQMGQRFKDIFLSRIGSISANELFRQFLGRDPTLNGYLKINSFR